jgi:hypothetical protein
MRQLAEHACPIFGGPLIRSETRRAARSLPAQGATIGKDDRWPLKGASRDLARFILASAIEQTLHIQPTITSAFNASVR